MHVYTNLYCQSKIKKNLPLYVSMYHEKSIHASILHSEAQILDALRYLLNSGSLLAESPQDRYVLQVARELVAGS